ncbi:putative iron-sulfur domain containing protein [Cladophialophora carrionii]|uniref:Choline monooxygenase, chloroplastic n=1 Tax=Cladophialophora carrionii TaxID=86049 RepID=A0A1C1D1Z0_9EURO|nr:putative iron-sulfur domain containing protein [Cladophialophora carrionii]
MANVKTKPAGVLPASWYSTRAIYELERRAIFAKHWLLITHELRLPAAGAYAKFTVAGYPFFIIRDKQGELNAFLNVCRHRAFPVVLQDEGVANILACKYHGWSYALNGKLAKAPRFDAVDGFDKSDYGLFQIHLRVDQRGFIWVNLDAAPEPEVKWEEFFDSVDTQGRLQAFDMKNYRYDHSWDMDGEYNWKTLIDNYNECYHCSVAHPGIAKVTNLESYDVKTTNGFIEHYAESKGDPADAAGNVAPTFVFPNASITMT